MLDFICEMGLRNWTTLGQILKNDITEEQLQSMLDAEMETKKRRMFVIRIHQRLSKVRVAREREELIKNTYDEGGRVK